MESGEFDFHIKNNPIKAIIVVISLNSLKRVGDN